MRLELWRSREDRVSGGEAEEGEAQSEEGEGRPEKIVLSASQAFIVCLKSSYDVATCKSSLFCDSFLYLPQGVVFG